MGFLDLSGLIHKICYTYLSFHFQENMRSGETKTIKRTVIV